MDMWTVRSIVRWIADDLKSRNIESAQLDADLLVAYGLGVERMSLYLDMDRPLAKEELGKIRALVTRRRRYEPMAYIMGKKEFYGRDFIVKPGVLIPRPETELLVERALNHLANANRDAIESAEAAEKSPDAKTLRILDVGTGSCAIAITLAKEIAEKTIAKKMTKRQRLQTLDTDGAIQSNPDQSTSERLNERASGQALEQPLGQTVEQTLEPISDWEGAPSVQEPSAEASERDSDGDAARTAEEPPPTAHILATDISADALRIAQENVDKHQVAEQVNLLQSDLFNQINNDTLYDLLVSNPPYIDPQDRERLAPDIIGFEPEQALFADQQGLKTIENLIEQAPEHMRVSAWMVLECGTGQGAAICELMARRGFENFQVHKDLAGHDRVVEGQWTSRSS